MLCFGGAVHATTSPSGHDDSFSALWRRAAALYDDAPLLVWDADGGECSFAEADRLVRAMSAALRRRGLTPGDRVMLRARPHPEALLTIWSAWLSNLVVVPLDPDAPQALVRQVARRVGPSLVVGDPGPWPDPGQAPVLLDPPSGGESPKNGTYISDIIDVSRDNPQAFVDPDQASEQRDGAWVFTSGSTGQPKGVRLSRGALVRSGRTLARTYGWRPGDRLLCALGLHGISGLRNPALAALWAGVTVVIPRRRRLAVDLAGPCARRRVTLVTGTPTLVHRLAADDRRLSVDDFADLRLVMTTGLPLDHRAARRLERRLGLTVRSYYGLTETCGICLAQSPARPLPDDGVIGEAVGAEVQVRDRLGRACPDQTPGRLWVRSPNLMAGYLDDSAGCRVVDGWLDTGDRVERGPDGLVRLLGRDDDRVKTRHGEVLYLRAVRRAALAHPGVVDARAEQQARAGEPRVVLEVVCDPSCIHDLRDHLLEELGRHRQPDRVDVVSSLPDLAETPPTGRGRP